MQSCMMKNAVNSALKDFFMCPFECPCCPKVLENFIIFT